MYFNHVFIIAFYPILMQTIIAFYPYPNANYKCSKNTYLFLNKYVYILNVP